MYVDAILKAVKFTRPIHIIWRGYGSTLIEKGAASLFFVNDTGWAITCGHVVDQIVSAGQLAKRKSQFESELKSKSGSMKAKALRRTLEKKYKIKRGQSFEVRHRFMNCIKGNLDFTLIRHKTVDLALIHFENYTKLLCDQFPLFAKDTTDLLPGKMLCRLGYPFVEFENFEYDPQKDKIQWTTYGKSATPRFPIEGMVTRRILDSNETVIAFEMSRPGLRGQSGGPVFDEDCVIYGVQSGTNHLDLNFDINQSVIRSGKQVKVKDHTFLNVGVCIHLELIKEFMNENNVSFNEN